MLCAALYGQAPQTPAEWWADAPVEARAAITATYWRNWQHGVGYTMAALKAIESAGDQFTLALGENSCGGYLQSAKYVAHRVLMLPVDSLTVWQISRICERLMRDPIFDDEQARAKIDELRGIHGNDWPAIWQGWNNNLPHQAELVGAWVRFLANEIKSTEGEQYGKP